MIALLNAWIEDYDMHTDFATVLSRVVGEASTGPSRS